MAKKEQEQEQEVLHWMHGTYRKDEVSEEVWNYVKQQLEPKKEEKDGINVQ